MTRSDSSDPSQPQPSLALALIREGWRHLQLQRPLAARAAWQRAVLASPHDPAARQALERLDQATDLPAIARAEYRLVSPTSDERRTRWDEAIRATTIGLENLDQLPLTFKRLCASDPADAEAWYNQALGHAWMGANVEAIACLDRFVALVAGTNPERAAEAWSLAEVLRLGAGAESLADDLRYLLTLDLDPAHGPPAGLLRHWPHLHPTSIPTDPLTGEPALPGAQVFNWHDRPELPAGHRLSHIADLPRLLAVVILTPRFLRLSFPDPNGLDGLESDPTYASLARSLARARREKTPLPIAQADLALGSFLLPAELDESAHADLTRGIVEHYYENLWIHQPRQSLGNLSPLQASFGTTVDLAKLVGLIRFREQLGERPSRIAIYQGYPFDRLRRRLGVLAPGESPATDGDFACLGKRELDALDPASLSPEELADATRSVAALGDDASTSRFAAELLTRATDQINQFSPTTLIAPLVREALRLGDEEQAFQWLEQAGGFVRDKHRRTLAIWTAELHARTGSPEAALGIYQGLLEQPDSDAALALDGAETLLDNNAPEHAIPLLQSSHHLAIQEGREDLRARAAALIHAVTGESPDR